MVNDVEFGFGQNRIITTLAGTKAGIRSVAADGISGNVPDLDQSERASSAAPDGAGWFPTAPSAAPRTTPADTSMWNIAPYGNHEDLYTIQDNISKVHGNHLFKAGVFLSSNEKVENNGNGADRPGLPQGNGAGNGCITTAPVGRRPGCFNTGNPLANILLRRNAARPRRSSPALARTASTELPLSHWRDIEPYVGDTWKVSRKAHASSSASAGRFTVSLTAVPTGVTHNAAFDGGGNYPNQWANWDLSKPGAQVEATANPRDACNGILIVPGTTPCANQVKIPRRSWESTCASFQRHARPKREHWSSKTTTASLRAWAFPGTCSATEKRQFASASASSSSVKLVGLAEGMANNAPFELNINTNRSMDTVAPLTSASVSPSYAKSTGGHLPNSWQYNISVEQEIARNTTMQIGYVGNAGTASDRFARRAMPFRTTTGWLAAFARGTAQNALRPAYNFGDDRRLLARRPGQLPIPASTVQGANRGLLNLPGCLHMVAFTRRRG